LGIDLWAFNFLVTLQDKKFGDTLCLGRQGIHLLPTDASARQIAQLYDPKISLEQLLGSTGYAEPFLRNLGSTDVKSLDYSNYEGADFVVDLNYPIRDELKERFDTVLDGGTLEHVFNFPVAIESVKAMTKIGGRVIMITPANNCLGHGFYQFSPELLYRVFSDENGFSVDKMDLVEIWRHPEPRPMRDPKEAGHPIELGTTQTPAYLCMSARKRLNVPTQVVLESGVSARGRPDPTSPRTPRQ
jgi:hypothetical protein